MYMLEISTRQIRKTVVHNDTHVIHTHTHIIHNDAHIVHSRFLLGTTCTSSIKSQQTGDQENLINR